MLKAVLTNHLFLIVWGMLVAACLAVLIYDLTKKNSHIAGMMKWVWGFTVAYSGPIGLAVYFYAGRKEISDDTVWRKGFRSTAHCYSGCGAGEITGVFIAAGLLSLGNWPVAIITFCLAYVAGFALTVAPLMQEGVSLHQALKDAVISETPSIFVMEVTAVGIDLWLASNAKMSDPLFWSSLVFSLTAGLAAAYPVNVALVHWGVKHGMADPRNTEMAGQGG